MRLTALVAPYLDDIRAKRRAGWRWEDIGRSLGVDASPRAIGQAVARCKWVADQKPLPPLIEKGRVSRPPGRAPVPSLPASGGTIQAPADPIEENARILSDLGVQVLK